MSDHNHQHAAHHNGGEAHATRRDYVIGFVLSVVLTAIPFWLVMSGQLSNQLTAFVITAFATVQIVVHMIYFLHMSPKSEGGWSLTALVFTIIIIAIMLFGSIWVMYHLNTNMMPMPQEMAQLP